MEATKVNSDSRHRESLRDLFDDYRRRQPRIPTLTATAKLLGISHSHFSNVMAGRFPANPELHKRMCELFRVSAKRLDAALQTPPASI